MADCLCMAAPLLGCTDRLPRCGQDVVCCLALSVLAWPTSVGGSTPSFTCWATGWLNGIVLLEILGSSGVRNVMRAPGRPSLDSVEVVATW
jgi:hypothetical protein